MAAYFIAEMVIKDPALYTRYRELALPTLVKHGAKPVVRSEDSLLLEGEVSPDRVVILEFPSVEAALAWYRSEDYQKAAAIRQQASSGRVMICERLPYTNPH
ncbi:MAG: DUF1330 domain-containing protein [Hyphomicrobiaceae bacterium]